VRLDLLTQRDPPIDAVDLGILAVRTPDPSVGMAQTGSSVARMRSPPAVH
jgi:hypothetical protein